MLWMRTIASLRPFPMSAGNFVGNTIEKAAVLPISIPLRKKYLVYSLFTRGEAFVGATPLQQNDFSPTPCSRKMRIQIRARRWAPKQPLYRNNAPPNPKTSECQRAGHKPRGGGGHPPRLFASGLSLEKAWIPRPGPGGEPRCRSGPAQVQKEPPADSAAAPKGSVSPHPLTRETW